MGDWGKVFVATRYQPYLPAQSCESLIGLAVAGLRPGDVRDFVYSKTMHKAANILARRFLAGACDSMCFIDSDAVFGAPALEELRADVEGQGYDVLQAFTTKRGWPPEPMYLMAMPDQPQGVEGRRGRHFTTGLPLDGNYVYAVGAVSLHFTLIKRWVFEALLDLDGSEHTYWFEYSRDQGEDVTFSLNAQRVGAKLGMSTRLKVGHVSDVVTGWDTMVDYYDRKLAVEMGEPPADLRRFLPVWEAQKALSALVAEWTGETADQVYERSLQGGLPVADRWQVARPDTAEAVRRFYGSTREYLYDLVKWNVTPAFQKVLASLKDVRGEYVFEIGGGLGTLAEMLAVNGNEVDYFDVPGVLRDFAAWRFGRLNGQVGRVHVMGDDLRSLSQPVGGYDRIVAVDVLEHVHPDEIGVTLAALGRRLRSGGWLTAHNNWSQQDGVYPQHFDHSAAWAEFVEGYSQVDAFTWRRAV